MLTETLLGGLCDGLETPKTDEPLVYAGRAGDGKIQVYTREAAVSALARRVVARGKGHAGSPGAG